MSHVIQLLDQYGYIILFLALMLELIALPIPTEFLMSYVGYLAYKGQLNLYASILIAALGTSLGMTISYAIGYRLGYPFFRKYGHRFHIGEAQLEKLNKLFSKYGVSLLLISCFIPGVRHITGYFSGITHSKYRRFAPFAYAGALLWVSTFIGLGRALGPQYKIIEASIKRYLVIGVVIVGLLLIGYLLIKYNREKIKTSLIFWLDTFSVGFRSQRRLMALIGGAATIFIGLVVLLAGFLQDLLSHDFDEFNRLSMLVIHALFGVEWAPIMKGVFYLGHWSVLMGMIVLTVLWIIWLKHWRLDLVFYVGALLGGWVFSKGIHFLLLRIARSFHLPMGAAQAFPNLALVYLVLVYGFLVYSFSRHSRHHWVKPFLFVMGLGITAVVALASLYFTLLLPSELLVSLVVGAVWLSLSVLLLEIRRLVFVI